MEDEMVNTEMQMRAGEDIGIGEDITPPLSPLSFSLHDSFIHSHCSSCFCPLPNRPSHSTTIPHSLLYCSPLCSSFGSLLHFHSAEFHLLRCLSSTSPPPSSTSDLRAALRLLRLLPSHSSQLGRTSGLLTNRHKLLADEQIVARIRCGARAMAIARRLRDGKQELIEVDENEYDAVLFEEEEAALCLVLTNSVEVQDNDGRTLGIAVYDPTFSWINHSCSPNSCYRFLISPPSTAASPADSKLRIVPSCSNGEKSVYSNIEFRKGYGEYGPRMIVRSIKRIKRSEEVTVAYTDLLQPKAIRRSELWSKYCFICCCKRCSASPPAYVDHILQEITASNHAPSRLSSDHSSSRDEANRKLTDYVDEIISEYLSVGDPESCCEKLESILVLGLHDEPLETKEGKIQLNFRLHPLHHMALNAYITLASSYKIHANDMLALCSEMNGHQLKPFHMSRAGAAYSFLLAAAAHHLFSFETSLIVSVANFWTSAGESLLTFARSSAWDLFGKQEITGLELLSHGNRKCSKCSFLDKFEANFSLSQNLNEDFENISSKFLDCISSYSREVWNFLSQGSHYLKMFKEPFDFSSSANMPKISDLEPTLCRKNMDSYCWSSSGLEEAQQATNQERINILHLGVHCLLFGEYLASICYGTHSHYTRQVQRLVYCDDK
ncbi:protein SET DOMAIN GROUP 41 isoform X2 [Manihot esculenta]|uniref:Uncharacterized protein n=1 Tax=Manihot esculenta TaxID=3983 RepID=A0ACB7I6P8_MANES|nr:protein SET DOMAIN GROUP 41 isoform X2 [Manihot esculenta]KAG8660613.1 hypothetical protein MANES_02G180601v8 [Manihot esculenta]